MMSLSKTLGIAAAGVVLASGCGYKITKVEQEKNPTKIARVGQRIIGYNGDKYAGMPNKETFSTGRSWGHGAFNCFYPTNIPQRIGDVEILSVTPSEIKYRGVEQ